MNDLDRAALDRWITREQPDPYEDDAARYTEQEAFDDWYGVEGPDPDSEECAEAADRFRHLVEMDF